MMRACSVALIAVFAIGGVLAADIQLAPDSAKDAGHVEDGTSATFDALIEAHDVVLVNFYADWCRFSQMLKPIYDQTGVLLAKRPELDIKLVKVDCDKEEAIASQYGVNKYPTLRLFRGGKATKREFRGQRSAEKISSWLFQHAEPALFVMKDADDVQKVQKRADPQQNQGSTQRERVVVGLFESEEKSIAFHVISERLRDQCGFAAAFDASLATLYGASPNSIVFTGGDDGEQHYTGDISNEDQLHEWAEELCDPIVKEITFQNGEELTEAGLPFLILFYNPDDKTNDIRTFTETVANNLRHERGSIQFLVANGLTFAHPLHHMGKTKKDLPVLAIDSFKHMYDFGDIAGMSDAQKLQQFINDLHSGKLHHELHHGKPPESKFKELEPSKQRYSMRRDEL